MKTLVAVDDSDASWAAARFAERLLGPDDEVVVLNVDAPTRPLYLAAGGLAGYPPSIVPDPEIVESRPEEDAAERLVERAGEVADADEVVVGTGEPGEVICRTAADEGVELIVVGTNDKNALVRFFTGSVSDYVLSNAPCPVLVVR